MVDENGEMVGVVPLSVGLDRASSAGLDLIEISPNAEPPVCKILDYGKFRYEQQKKTNASKKKQKVNVTKELKLRPNIEDHDLQVKLKAARKFLHNGDKVRFSLMFRGRENDHKDLGFVVIEKVKDQLDEIAKPEFGPKLDGRQIIMIVAPRQQV